LYDQFCSKFKNKNFWIYISKMKFLKNISLWHTLIFSRPGVAKFIKRLQKIHITLTKIVIYCIPNTWWYDPEPFKGRWE
jgi:myosin-crossreactive antigen